MVYTDSALDTYTRRLQSSCVVADLPMYSLEVGQQPGLSSRLRTRQGVPAKLRHLQQSGHSQQATGQAAEAPPSLKGCLAQPRWVPIGPGRGLRLLDVSTSAHSNIPAAQGLFDPANDKDACGVGFVGELSKNPSRKCVKDALQMLVRMSHRGACGCEANTGMLPQSGCAGWIVEHGRL